MKISKTKIKFTDIAGMLDRDQMREITGGCGVSTGSAMTIQSGGLGCSASWSNTSSCWSSITGMGFGGALSYGGVSASSPGFSSSGSSANGSTASNFGGVWTNTSVGVTTSDSTTIKRFMSYLETENVLYNNNPTALQMISFLNEDRLTNGRGTLSNGSVLANEITLYKLGNTLQWTNNPYEQLIKSENLAHIMQNMGNAITAGGLTFSATGVGSVVGVPMSSFGTAMNSVRTAWEVGLQAYDAYNGINTNQNLINI